MNISLCMIAKNEEEFIGGAIESAVKAMGFTDIVVADTGSTDKTKEIATAQGARVFDFEWVGDFSAARNFAAQQAENDWILMIDADEDIIEADLEAIQRLIENEETVGIITIIELTDKDRTPISRLYNRKKAMFKGSIHEQIEQIELFAEGTQKQTKGQTKGQPQKQPKKQPQKQPKQQPLQRIHVPISALHYGYALDVQNKKGKFERNVSMLEKELEKNPDDPYYLYQIGKCYAIFDRDLEKACEYFEKVLAKSDEIYNEYFYNAVESYGYALINTGKYREALNIIEVYLEHYVENPKFRFLSAHIFQNNGLFVEAVECYESCIGANMVGVDAKGITSYLSYYNIGVILECVEMLEDAIEMYKNCGDYEPALARLAELENNI